MKDFPEAGDVPFVDQMIGSYSAHKMGGTNINYVERRIDLDVAKDSDVFKSASTMRLMNFAIGCVQDRDSNKYHTLYFMGPEDGSPTKIGIAQCAARRLAGVQTSHWETIHVHALLFFNDGDAFAIEQEVLKQAKKTGTHARGEWIWASPETVLSMALDAARKLKLKAMTPAMVFLNQGLAMKARDKALRGITRRAA